MTPSAFEAEKAWLGWRALASRTFNLRPAEAHALALMVRWPGRAVSFDVLAEFDGDGLMGSRNFNGSRGGICNRIVRLRSKLSDVGCSDCVITVRPSGIGPAHGYVISPACAARIDRALRAACGVELAA